MADNLSRALAYLAALESGDTEAALGYLAADVIQEEFPNRLVPHGATRNLDEMREGARRGKQVMRSQRFEILSMMSDGDRVALEVQWTGTLAIPLGTLPADGQMRARFGVFLTFREGLIVRQHNYDCFDPW
jgi:ketosteroid isomerase-like protein